MLDYRHVLVVVVVVVVVDISNFFFSLLEGVPEPPLPGESGSYLLRASRVHLFLFCSPSKGF